MNHTLQVGLAWFGGFSAIAYVSFGVWVAVVSAVEHTRLQAKRADLRARRKPITENEISAVDIDNLAELLKGDQQ